MSELRECGFCGRQVDIVPSKYWLRIQGDHAKGCPVADYEFAWPNTDEGLNDLMSEWNRRPHPAPTCDKCVDGAVTEFIVRNDKDLTYPCPNCTLPPAGHPEPVRVRVPETGRHAAGSTSYGAGFEDGWNACREEVIALNPQPGAVVGDEVVAHFVEEVAKIISGAPFPSGRSMTKAREISDLVLRTLTNTDKGLVERCEAGQPECGPVEFHDSEGVPLCRVCWDGLVADSAQLDSTLTNTDKGLV